MLWVHAVSDRLKMFLSYVPLAVVCAGFTLVTMPSTLRYKLVESTMYPLGMGTALIVSSGIMLWVLIHLYFSNTEVDLQDRFAWTMGILFLTIFVIPRYIARFMLSERNPPSI